ncbi:nucleotidyltransferase domain-containing protein [Inediibacterium massiliense]|uniref:nucleotidyltransferase domain-containing protein n=1 Tax=Inediibacterium massiliense TaxID=1658111 RepID=UPI0006B5326C|nr:nucleotidyltransferase [Inediibacterium massiliense]
MGLQKYFDEFNKKIKMDYDENSLLAEKRDILLEKLEKAEDLPSFKKLDQGSYSMFTGVEPLDKDYDIDVGLRFEINKDDIEPVELKEKVYDVVKNHTHNVEIRKPCITVYYKEDGEIAYHVDLVVYAYEDKEDTDSQLYLARGTKYSKDENKYWEEADPKGLKDKIMNKFEEAEERAQYRRIIRYLKRWKNIKFSSDGNAEPPGIGITLLAYEFFDPKEYDILQCKYVFNDLKALKNLVEKIIDRFIPVEYSQVREEYLYEIELNLPVQPYTNVFSKMSNNYMTDFKNKLEKLLKCLKEVDEECDVIEQCKLLAKEFGEDFPIPTAEEVSKRQEKSILSNSHSA